jgi:TolB-like protein/Tfp pilus assembly protein PilF
MDAPSATHHSRGSQSRPGVGETGDVEAPDAHAALVHAELERLLRGPLASSPQLARFLEYVVLETLAGRGDRLKEYSVAVQALGRPASFDPSDDAAVRVAARQLRFKLAAYYATPTAISHGGVQIELPKGTYVPQFHRIEPPIAKRPAPTAAFGVGPLVAVALAALSVVGAFFWARRSGGVSDRAVPVVAVLPFANLTGDSAASVLSEGLSVEVSTALARDSLLQVIARTSTLAFRDRPIDIRDIARQLGATHVIEGSVRRAGARYRIAVQLHGAEDGARLWAEQYDLDSLAAFALYDIIATGVHTAVARTHATEGGELPVASGPHDPRVPALMLEGRYFWNQRTDSSMQRARHRFEQAIALDSQYAPSWAALSGVLATMEANHITPPGQSAARALRAADRAIALDPRSGEAWAAIGLMRGFHQWQWTAADSAFRRAIAVAPSYATARSWYSNVLLAQGDVEAALAQLRAAQRLDPLSLPLAYGLAQAYYYGRQWDAGLRAIDRALQIDPDFSWTRLLQGKLLKGAGRRREARAVFAALGDSVEMALLDSTGRADRITRLVGAMPEDVRRRSQFWLATLYAQVGMPDSAFQWLERAYAIRQSDLSSILVDPMIDPLKADPRYSDVVRRIGLRAPSTLSGGRAR